MTLTTINQLTESRLFRHKQTLTILGEKGIRDLTFLYVLALYIMYNEPETHDKAVLYAKRTKSYRDFKEFYIGGTDLYLLINSLIGEEKEWSSQWPFTVKKNKALIKKPLLLMFLDRLANAKIEREFVHRFLLDVQNTLNIQNSSLRSARRYVQDWHVMGQQKKNQVLTQMLSYIRSKAKQIEIYDDVANIYRKYS
tara:strand:- start:1450 stop:2037 length:588 start_codon:yes stop_codon:yes gene_type:complete